MIVIMILPTCSAVYRVHANKAPNEENGCRMRNELFMLIAHRSTSIESTVSLDLGPDSISFNAFPATNWPTRAAFRTPQMFEAEALLEGSILHTPHAEEAKVTTFIQKGSKLSPCSISSLRTNLSNLSNSEVHMLGALTSLYLECHVSWEGCGFHEQARLGKIKMLDIVNVLVPK
jgi:hypothetical protein